MRKSMMQNLPTYVRIEGEQTYNILEEVEELTLKKKRIFLSNVIRYSLPYFHTNIPIINERVSISILVFTEKKSLRDNLMLWNVPYL